VQTDSILKMDFLKSFKDHKELYGIGFLMGVVLTLLLVFIYMMYFAKSGELFIDPGWDPETKLLVEYHNAVDPGSNSVMKKLYGKEKMENKLEAPQLVALLYR
jgi:hypothetical protein